jgi:hypothetical protein
VESRSPAAPPVPGPRRSSPPPAAGRWSMGCSLEAARTAVRRPAQRATPGRMGLGRAPATAESVAAWVWRRTRSIGAVRPQAGPGWSGRRPPTARQARRETRTSVPPGVDTCGAAARRTSNTVPGRDQPGYPRSAYPILAGRGGQLSGPAQSASEAHPRARPCVQAIYGQAVYGHMICIQVVYVQIQVVYVQASRAASGSPRNTPMSRRNSEPSSPSIMRWSKERLSVVT